MADRGAAGERANHFVAVESARDMAGGAVGVEARSVEAGDPRRFLSAMLQRMEPECDEASRDIGIPNAEDPAFLAKLVVVEGIGRPHQGLPAAEGEDVPIGDGRRIVA